MEATAAHHGHHHEPMPTSGSALNSVAFSATLHCLTGCAIGEVLGMIIGTALGFSDLGTIALAVGLAFLFGYGLTSLPLLRAGFTLAAVVPIALATDTFSITVMEIVDNGIMLSVPGAMESGVGDVLFWGALSVALVIAGVVAYPVNRWLIARGKGHAVLHETGIHGGPPTKLVATIAAAMAVFGTTVLVAEAFTSDDDGHGGGHAAEKAPAGGGEGPGGAGEGSHRGANGEEQDPVRGLAVAGNGMKLELSRTDLPRGKRSRLSFRVVSTGSGKPVRDFEVEHDKRMHLIVARRDMEGFQHLHPKLAGDGTWSTPITVPAAGSYRVFTDFKRRGENHTLAADLAVDGELDSLPLGAEKPRAGTADGYRVRIDGSPVKAGEEAELSFTVTRGGKRVQVDAYLGAKGHLVALRQGDLAYLHVHPTDAGHGGKAKQAGEPIRFTTEFPSDGRYGLFLQFKHQGEVHTAAFTREVAR